MACMWRTDDPVIDDDGTVIKGGMFEHQRQWWQSQAFIKALVGGYGCGKTSALAKRGIASALHNNGSPYMIVSPTYKMAKRTIIPGIIALLNGRGIPYRYNKTDHEFRFVSGNNRGLIWIGSGEDPEALKGPNLCGAGIDEPFIQDKAVFDQMLARVRDPVAKHRDIVLTGTPEDLNWGYDICEGDDRDKYDLEMIQASSADNLALPADVVATLRRAYDSKMAAAYIGGKFVNMAVGRIYYGFSRERCVVSKKMPDEVELRVGMDFNVNPMAAVVFWTQGNHMHYFDEIELPNSDTEEMRKYLLDKYPAITTFYPDPSGKSRATNAPAGRTDFRILEGLAADHKEVKARNKAPTRRDRFNATNKKLVDGSLTISPKCKKLIKYFEQLAHEKIKKQDEMTHLTDGATYPVEYIYPIKRIITRGTRYV